MAIIYKENKNEKGKDKMKKAIHESLEAVHTHTHTHTSIFNVKEKSEEAGITLIALVVTIIVLLILAGISITMLTGENGILSRAGEASTQFNQSSLEEEVSLKIMERTTDLYLGEAEDLGYYLEQVSGVAVTQLAEDVWYVTRDTSEVTVYEDGEIVTGKVDVWDGTSVSCPVVEEDENNVFHWYIYTSAQLKFLADFVNNENKLEGEVASLTSLVEDAGYDPDDVTLTEDTVVYLMNDLDLGARQTDGELTSGTEWTPIGKVKDYQCIATFEGNEYTIRGVYINSTTNFNGIFGNANTIQNLTVKDSYIAGATCTGGIVGALRSGNIENCHNINTTVVLIDGSYNSVGGICGQFTGTEISNCSNTGAIIAYGANSSGESIVGGIVGYAYTSSTVTSCTNSGTVTGEGHGTGGVVGCAVYIVTECSNTGNITGSESVGGIIGVFHVSYQQQISKCYNSGTVTGTNYIGGINGGFGKTGATMTLCYNKGTIKGSSSVGTIIGWSSYDTEVTNCYYYTDDETLIGVGALEDGGTITLEELRQGTTLLKDVDLKTYDEFIEWIENL